MRDININISKARIESFTVTFSESGVPDIDATLGLYTENGKRVSEYRASSRLYYGNKADFPMEVHTHLSNACEVIERVVHRLCNGEMNLLESTNKIRKPTKTKKTEPVEVINLEDIPF